MRHGSLFSGIGGFDLASEWMGWENVFHCEWNEFGQKVLKYYWPKAISYNDITKTDFSVHRGTIDILTGGFPCQPYSMAGKRLGKEDERHLWPEMLRCIREIQPTWVVGENVLGLVNWNGGLVFHEVQADLEAQGYEVQPYVLPAASVNAPHRRDRVWFVAYSTSNGHDAKSAKTNNEFRQDYKQSRTQWFSSFEGFSNEWNASDSNSFNSGKGNREKVASNRWKDSEYQSERSEVWDKHSTISGTRISIEDASDSECIRLEHSTEGGQIRGEETNASREGNQFTLSTKADGNGYQSGWENFPTKSPICTRDDGISDRMDSITFSKWRNESIKAGGNAIVPQVVYQIFKAIEQYETTRHTQGTKAES